jgi:hypothetical protein
MASAPVEPALAAVDFAVALTVADFAAVTGVTLTVAVFVATVTFAVIGSVIVASTTSLSSGILETHSFTIRIHITDTILTDITPTFTDTILTINPVTRAELIL